MMSSELCPDAAVVHITTPQIITNESVVTVGAGAGGARAAGGGAMELGRRLLLAARAGDTALVLDLMAKGAPFTTDWLGTSPLHLAASNDHVETCGVLLRAGVSRDSRTKVDRTPLHLAAYAGHATVAALLLEHGAHVDCRDMLRMTPLHWAAERGHAGVAAELLRRGADARALSKFRKTPAQLAAARAHAHVLALLDDALREREAARSVRPLLPLLADREEPTEPPRPAVTTVHRVQEIKILPKPVPEKIPKPEIKIAEVVNEQKPSEEGGSTPGAAAALLRRHGITLLPADDGSTLLNALQSGRTVVLSDAGKLMLKESGSPTPVAAAAVASPAVAAAAGPAVGPVGSRGRGVVLTATPVRAPPPGVKVFTLNNRHKPKDQPRRIALNENQVKIVQLPAHARARRLAPAPARAPVKIIMNKTNFERLVAGARREPDEPAANIFIAPDSTATEASPRAEATPAVAGAAVAGAAAAGTGAASRDPAALAAALAAAQRAVASLSEELRTCRARLARYEPA